MALSTEPHISVDRRQSAPLRTHSSSSSCSNITAGQLCLSRLSEQAFHPDTLHTPAAESKLRFSQAQTSSVIPAAGINRFPFQSVSPVMKLKTFSGDMLTVTNRLQKLTRSQQADFVPGSNSSDALLGTTGETIQRKKKEDEMLMISNVKQSDGVTGDRLTTIRSEHVANTVDEFNSTSFQTENETKQNDLSNADGKDKVNNIIMTPKHYHHRFEIEEASPDTVTATNGRFGHVTSDVETNDGAGTSKFFLTDNQPERPKIQSDHEPNSSFVNKHRVAKTTERHNSQSLSQPSESNNPIANSNSSIDVTLYKIINQISAQTRNLTSQFQINIQNPTDFVSLTATPDAFRDGFKSPLTTSETLRDSKKSTQNGVEHRSQPYAHNNPLTQRELPITHAPDKLTSAVSRIKTMETHSVQEQTEQEIVARAAKQAGQHALLSTTGLSHTINMPVSRFLKMAHRAEDSYSQTSAAAAQMSY